MKHDQFQQHVVSTTDEPSYRAGFRAGLEGASTPQHFAVLLEQALWSDGWEAGSAEATRAAATKNCRTNDDVSSAGHHEPRR